MNARTTEQPRCSECKNSDCQISSCPCLKSNPFIKADKTFWVQVTKKFLLFLKVWTFVKTNRNYLVTDKSKWAELAWYQHILDTIYVIIENMQLHTKLLVHVCCLQTPALITRWYAWICFDKTLIHVNMHFQHTNMRKYALITQLYVWIYIDYTIIRAIINLWIITDEHDRVNIFWK